MLIHELDGEELAIPVVRDTTGLQNGIMMLKIAKVGDIIAKGHTVVQVLEQGLLLPLNLLPQILDPDQKVNEKTHRQSRWEVQWEVQDESAYLAILCWNRELRDGRPPRVQTWSHKNLSKAFWLVLRTRLLFLIKNILCIVGISDEEIQALAAPFKFTLLQKFPLYYPLLDNIQFLFSLKLSGDFLVMIIDSRHVLIKCSNDLYYTYYVNNYCMKLIKRTLMFDISAKSQIVPIGISFTDFHPHLLFHCILNWLGFLFCKPL
ncbi:hypothetical protein IEQ34_018883 [Dendrobium chrysotoxum]|uniref:Uncharacterized protein n=1 Tax=Dendrobium chrysotoxum TaxID=161865 RepID=A0AAV7G6I9_DENCH|nr:hypothetical protein IEQ34_018883 [Dendrobium chrysotoxum]